MSQAQQLRTEWREVFQHRGKRTTLYLYENMNDGSIDLVQINDQGESITTQLNQDAVNSLLDALGA